jgi:hypothetical protein
MAICMLIQIVDCELKVEQVTCVLYSAIVETYGVRVA